MNTHSFAVLAYKDSPYLSDCLSSLTNQSVKSDIYISTSTPSPYIQEIADKYGVKVFIAPLGKGIANDWNFGLSHARTKYVTLAHQDDLYDPDYTLKCITAAEKFKDTLICFCNYSETTTQKNRTHTFMLTTKRLLLWMFMPLNKNIKSKFWKKKSLSFGNPISCPGVMYNRSLLSDFQFSEKYNINLDWDAWLRMADMNGRFVYVPLHLFKHRIHIDSATTEGLRNNDRQSEDLEIYHRIWPAFIANTISKFYSASYKSNKINQHQKEL